MKSRLIANGNRNITIIQRTKKRPNLSEDIVLCSVKFIVNKVLKFSKNELRNRNISCKSTIEIVGFLFKNPSIKMKTTDWYGNEWPQC